jgi:hypothetical protein
MTSVRVAALIIAVTLLSGCAHRPGPIPCGCLPPAAETPAKA